MAEFEVVRDLTERSLIRKGDYPGSGLFSYSVNITKRDLCLPLDTNLGDILGVRLEDLLCRYGRPFCRECRVGLVSLAEVLGGRLGESVNRVAAYVPWRVLHDDLALKVVGEIYSAERVVYQGEVRRLSRLPEDLIVRGLSQGGVVLDTHEWGCGDLSWLGQLGETVGFPLGLAMLRGRVVADLIEVKGSACCPQCRNTFPVDCASSAVVSGESRSPQAVTTEASFESLSDALQTRRLVPKRGAGFDDGVVYGVQSLGGATLLSDTCGNDACVADVLHLFRDQGWTSFVDFQVLHWCNYLGIAELPINACWGGLSLAERYIVRCVHFLSVRPASCRLVIDDFGVLGKSERSKLCGIFRDVLDQDSKVLLLEDCDIMCPRRVHFWFVVDEPGAGKEVVVEPSVGVVLELCEWTGQFASPYQQCAEARRRQLVSSDFLSSGRLGFAAAQVRLGGYTLQELCDLPLFQVLEWEFLDFQTANFIRALVGCGMGSLTLGGIPEVGVRRALECFKVLVNTSSSEVVLSGVFAGIVPSEAEPIEQVLHYFCSSGKRVRVVSDQEWVVNRYVE